MSIFKNIGHAVASFLLGAIHGLTGQPTNGTAAQSIGAAAASLLEVADPQAQALVNAAVTGYGDIVQAVKATGGELKAGATITLVVSDALAAASTSIWPDLEKVWAAFENVIASKPEAPLTPPALVA